MEFPTLQMVSIPLVSLQTSAQFWRDEQKRYAENNIEFMVDWCDAKASVYERLLADYA